MTLKKPASPKSLMVNFQERICEKSLNNDIHRSFYLPRKSLTVIRVILLIFSFFSCGLSLYYCRDYHHLLSLPYISIVLQSAYFALVLLRSYKKRRSTVDEGDYKLVSILYEIVFSCQCFNFLYYCLFIFPKESKWHGFSLQNFAWISITIISFVGIWVEQLFNMIRFHSDHISFVFGTTITNLVIWYSIALLNDKAVYIGMNMTFIETFLITLLLLFIPAFHFVIGNLHYQHKKETKNDKIKRLSEGLASFKNTKSAVLTHHHVI